MRWIGASDDDVADDDDVDVDVAADADADVGKNTLGPRCSSHLT